MWQRSAHDRSNAYPDDLLDMEPQVVFEHARHRGGGEASDVIPVADVQRGRLVAGEEQCAVVQSGQVRDGEDQEPTRPDDPAYLV